MMPPGFVVMAAIFYGVSLAPLIGSILLSAYVSSWYMIFVIPSLLWMDFLVVPKKNEILPRTIFTMNNKELLDELNSLVDNGKSESKRAKTIRGELRYRDEAEMPW